MNKPPFPLPPVELLQQLASRLPAPPAWLRAELHNRLVLLLNHVLQQEPQAMDRLRRQQGKRLQLSWGSIELVLQPTPAGLLALSFSAPLAPPIRTTFPDAMYYPLARPCSGTRLVRGRRPKREANAQPSIRREPLR